MKSSFITSRPEEQGPMQATYSGTVVEGQSITKHSVCTDLAASTRANSMSVSIMILLRAANLK